jgi:predicted transcriptional regulator
MLTVADLLTLIQEEENLNIRKLAKKLEIPQEQLQEVIKTLERRNLLKYDSETEKITLPKWLLNINKKIEATKPTAGEIILPKYQEIQIQDIVIGNYTKEALGLKIWIKAKRKEIAICEIP